MHDHILELALTTYKRISRKLKTYNVVIVKINFVSFVIVIIVKTSEANICLI